MRITLSRTHHAQQLRSFIFGIEDGLVSTVGVLSGIASAQAPRSSILLTGIVLIFVEAFSMGVGNFLSESSSEAYMTGNGRATRTSIQSGITMFVGYFVFGFIPLSPYLFAEVKDAFPISVVASIGALFLLGLWSGAVTKQRIVRTGLRMMLLGGAAIGIGMLAGAIIRL